MSKRIPALLIADILTSIAKIESYTSGLIYESFLADRRTVEAVERNFEIIGEAANQLSKDFQQNNSHIPWHSVVSFRNRLIHGYFGVDYEIIWYVITVDLIDLKKQFERLQAGLDS
ncbi:HepT-like ribonuclease domain-containing protein [Spirosoma validum]|uniref:DUF86 domain-containing protein n=1 Tax=Spirosoma validum TaxID=2771355 RepID=A0A927GG94_9BACT|nr:DUF86 domain-containing protein [Spirosoma validum]MBD2756473.1 DUF86 domain-containing protein [Spirosoma validum]